MGRSRKPLRGSAPPWVQIPPSPPRAALRWRAPSVLVAVAIAGAVVLAARRNGERSAILTALALVLVIHALGPSLRIDPWNPWVPILPFALFLTAAWGVSDGDSALLPVAVGVGSFCVQ